MKPRPSPEELPQIGDPRPELGADPGGRRGRPRSLRIALGWGISAALILYIFQTAPLPEVWEGLRRVEAGSVLAAMSLVAVTMWFRGGRWALLFAPAHVVPAKEAAKVAILGLAVNAVLPGRVGEIARVGVASRKFGTGIVFTAATVVAERLLDGVTLLILLGASLAALPSVATPQSVEILGTEVSESALTTSFYSLAALCLVLAGATMVLSLSKPRRLLVLLVGLLPRALERRLVPVVETVFEDLKRGVAGLRRAKTVGWLLIYSTGIWAAITLANLSVAWGMGGFELTVGQALILTAVTVAASSIPSAPGAWGVFEAGGMLVLQAMQPGLDPGLAVAFLVTAHFSQYLPTVALGLALWLRARVEKGGGELQRSERGRREPGTGSGRS